jgi:hypothetical protein
MVNVFNGLESYRPECLSFLGAGSRRFKSSHPDPSSLKELRRDRPVFARGFRLRHKGYGGTRRLGRPVFVRNGVKNEDCHGVALSPSTPSKAEVLTTLSLSKGLSNGRSRLTYELLNP